MSRLPFHKLPPLHALAAFEAVARLQSFARAADELCVTQGAVSQRIKLLEKHYDVRLFVRGAGAATLTAQGTQLLDAAVSALSTLQEASEQLRKSRPLVRVSAGPSSAHNWLVRRLAGFYRDNPDIDLEISASQLSAEKKRASVETGEVDVALRYGRAEQWVGLECVKLMDVRLFAV